MTAESALALEGPRDISSIKWYVIPSSFVGVMPIYFFAYVPLFLSPMLVISLKQVRAKVTYAGAIYAAAIVMNIFAFGVMVS